MLVAVVPAVFILTPRKRRRQLYFASRKAKLSVGVEPKKKRKDRPTKDDGVWDEPLPEARRTVNISDKMIVVAYYNKLLGEEKKAKQTLAEPRAVKASRDQKAAMKEAKNRAKEVMKRNKQKMCQEKYPTIVGNAMVWKWRRSSIKERWQDLPAQVAQKVTTTPNLWRQRHGAPCRARKTGKNCMIPEVIQSQLDFLILAHARGLSDVSERREAITAETVATWLADRYETNKESYPCPS